MQIPTVDPMPVPAPLWLVRILLLVTFGLHLLFMNVLFGGSVVAFLCSVRRTASSHAVQLAGDLRHMLPIVFAFTITIGIAPLLFLQVLYGNLLYTSSILMAVPWLSVIALVMFAYYAVYFFSLRGERNRTAGAAVLGGAVLLLAAIGFIYSNNFTLMLEPSKWVGMYRNSAGGLHLNLADSMLVPRFVHFILAAFAITGLFLVVFGLRKRESGYGRWLLEQGALLFTAATIINYVVGFWFYVRIPPDARSVFTGNNKVATVALGLGFILPIAAIIHLMMLKTGKSVVRNASIAIASGVLTVAAMVVMRDALRNAYLAPDFQLSELRVAPQWSVIALFLFVFVVGLGVVGYMLRAVAKAKSESPLTSAAAK